MAPTKTRRWRHPNERAENHAAYALEETVWNYAASRYARGLLVDVGCGEKPLAEFFAPFVDRHVGVDHAATQHQMDAVDVVATAYDIPLADGSADTVVLSQVLEHLERPWDALKECFRLLRPGGHVLVTAPFVWHLHEEPRDFYRYSPHGLRYLLEAAGFEVVEVRPYWGAWTTVAVELSYLLRAWRGGILDKPVLAATWLLQRLGPWADRVSSQPGFSASHLAVGVKR